MPIRKIKIFGLVAAFAAGLALTPGTVSADAGRVLVTFLGLVAASILPTITLLINSMTASARSVQGITRLEAEIQIAMDALFLIFAAICIAVMALVGLSLDPAVFLTKIPYLTTEILPRLGQAVVVSAVGFILWRIGQIPGILRRSLRVRYEAALEEAKGKLANNAPEAAAIRQGFAPHSEFGKVVPLQGQDKR